MKVLGKQQIKKRNEVRHVMSERNVLKQNINHPFLVNLRYSFQTKDKLYFVLDYLNGGEVEFHFLFKKIRENAKTNPVFSSSFTCKKKSIFPNRERGFTQLKSQAHSDIYTKKILSIGILRLRHFFV